MDIVVVFTIFVEETEGHLVKDLPKVSQFVSDWKFFEASHLNFVL